jgi:hypothetical protein
MTSALLVLDRGRLEPVVEDPGSEGDALHQRAARAPDPLAGSHQRVLVERRCGNRAAREMGEPKRIELDGARQEREAIVVGRQALAAQRALDTCRPAGGPLAQGR